MKRKTGHVLRTSIAGLAWLVTGVVPPVLQAGSKAPEATIDSAASTHLSSDRALPIHPRDFLRAYPVATGIGGALALLLTGGLAASLVVNRNLARKRRLAEQSGRTHENLITEITERERLLNTMSQLSGTGGWQLDADSGKVTWTEQTFAIHDLPVSDQSSLKQALAFYHDSDRERLEAAIERSIANGEPYDLTLNMTTAKGREVIVHSLCQPLLREGRVVKLVGAFQDVTETTLNQRRLAEAERRFRQIFEQSPAAITVHDADSGTILGANRAGWERYAATSLADLQHRQHLIWGDEPYDFRSALAWIHRARDNGRQRFEWQSHKLNGEIVWEDVTLTPMWFDDGDSVLAIALDMTERHSLETSLRESEARFRTLIDRIPAVAVQGFAADGSVRYWNIAAERLYGYSAAEAMGANILELIVPPDRREVVAQKLDDLLHTRDLPPPSELELLHKDGTRVPVLTSYAIVERPGHDVEVFCMDVDLSEQKRHQAELTRIANYDTLTGLPNRHLLAELMERLRARADRNNSAFALCYLDLDRFKPINDTYGHAVGDQVLIEVADRLRRVVRGSDVVSRLGGDEFVVLLEGLGEGPDLGNRLSHILDSLANDIRVDDLVLNVQASIGVTIYPNDSAEPDTLLRHADQAMYHAKAQGRNCYRLFDTRLEQNQQQRRQQLEEIADALDQGQLHLVYQPKVHMGTGEVIGLEGLIRWNHPDRGLLLPHRFLDTIHGSNLERALGGFVMDRALTQMAIWTREGLELPISINLTGHDLLRQGFIEELRTALAHQPKIDPSWLEIEILETTAMDDENRAIAALNACRGLGVRVALDDFGTGYSSLGHLHSLPVDVLKIDQTFVRDMLTDISDYSIVQSVISLAHAFNLEVIAEGVETREQGTALLALGCPHAQGYALAHPMPPEEIPAWLAHWYEEKPWRRLSVGASAAPDDP